MDQRTSMNFPFSTGNTLFRQIWSKKIKSVCVSSRFYCYTNSNVQNSVLMFIFAVFDWKYPLWENYVQIIKIASLSWNSVSRLIRICRIQWWCWPFQFYTGNTLFVKRRWTLLSLWPYGNRHFEIGICHQHSFFSFVAVSVSVDCFYVLP